MRTAAACLLLLLLASPVRADDGATGTASTWQGPGAATHDCVFPWTSCTPRRVTSLLTGRSIVVTPTMFCDCYTGRVGPNGETERLIDLDPSQVKALGLPGPGLYDVRVELLSTRLLPNTATEGEQPMKAERVVSIAISAIAGALIFVAAVLIAVGAVTLVLSALQLVGWLGMLLVVAGLFGLLLGAVGAIRRGAR